MDSYILGPAGIAGVPLLHKPDSYGHILVGTISSIELGAKIVAALNDAEAVEELKAAAYSLLRSHGERDRQRELRVQRALMVLRYGVMV